MRFCEYCGYELPNPEARFCRNCGAALTEAEGVAEERPATAGSEGVQEQRAAPTLSTQEAAAPAPTTAVSSAPYAPAPARAPRWNRTDLILGGVVAIQVAAVIVLALLLAFGSGDTEAGEQKDPRLALAEEYERAWEKEDVEAYLACMDTSGISPSELDELEELLVWVFDEADISMVDLEFEVNDTGKDRAEVVIIGGELEVFSEGETTTMDFSEDPTTMKMIKIDNSWYMTEDPAFELAEKMGFYDL